LEVNRLPERAPQVEPQDKFLFVSFPFDGIVPAVMGAEERKAFAVHLSGAKATAKQKISSSYRIQELPQQSQEEQPKSQAISQNKEGETNPEETNPAEENNPEGGAVCCICLDGKREARTGAYNRRKS
jgi:hypothetical protein